MLKYTFKKLLLSGIMPVCYMTVSAQSEMSSFTATGRGGGATTFVTDYQAVGINPSNLGWKSPFEKKRAAFGLLEGAYSFYSEALAKEELRQSIFEFSKGEPLTYQQKVQAARDFTGSGFAFNVDVSPVAFSVQPNEEFGGFAFAVKEHIQWYSKFNQTLADILFLGYNADYFTHFNLNDGSIIEKTDSVKQLIESGDTAFAAKIVKGFVQSASAKLFSEILSGSKISFSWYREFNLSYGRKILANDKVSLYGGAGLKYIRGLAIIDITAQDKELNAFSAITPAFGIGYGDSAQASNPSYVEQKGILPKGVGTGFGIDIGVTAVFKEKLKVGFAINNIGSIKWTGNVFEAKNDQLLAMKSQGFESYNIFSESSEIVGEDGVFDWVGTSSKKTKLPTVIRLGGSYQPVKKLEVGIDIIMPLNDVPGNYEKAILMAGVDFLPVPWARLSAGISSGGNYGFNLPLGITVIAGKGTWEAGIASRDAITFFSRNTPTISLAAGFLRFRI